MKVQINQFETYEINYGKENLSINEFLIFIERLDNIKKLLVRQNAELINPEKNNSQIKIPRHYKKANARVWCDTREKTLYILSVFYSGTKEDRNKIIKKIGVKEEEIQKGFHGLKVRYNILPQEVGLVSWFKRGEGRNDKLSFRIPNFKVKDTSGYFESNENKEENKDGTTIKTD